MAVTIEENGLERIITVEEKGKVVKDLVDNIIKEISKNVSIKGFRKGHVPASVIKARYKDTIKEEVARKYIIENLNKIVEENNLRPVTDAVRIQEIELNGDKLVIKFTIEVEPEFELKEYKGLEFEVPEIKVTDEEVERVLETIRKEHYEEAGDDAVVEEGDRVEIHYKIESDKGEKEENNLTVEIGANQLRPEIEKEIIGKKKGDVIVVENVPLINEKGEEFGKAKVEVKILNIYKLPELNDEFIKKIGYAENLEEAKEKIRENLKKELEEVRKFDLKQRITDKLVEMHSDIEVPKTLLESQLNEVINDYYVKLERSGIKPNKEMIEMALPQLEKAARKRAIAVIVINKIAEKENIKVTEEDLDRHVEKLAEGMGASPEAVKQWLQSEGYLPSVLYELLKNKVLDLIIENAKIKEIPLEEYNKKYAPEEIQQAEAGESVEQKTEEQKEENKQQEENKEDKKE